MFFAPEWEPLPLANMLVLFSMSNPDLWVEETLCVFFCVCALPSTFPSLISLNKEIFGAFKGYFFITVISCSVNFLVACKFIPSLKSVVEVKFGE